MTQFERVSNPLLDFPTKVLEDVDIEYKQYHLYKPQALQDINSKGQAIQFIINQEDLYTVPSQSYIQFTGRLVKNNDNAFNRDDEVALINNAIMYLFSDIKYEINDIEVEKITNPGQTTTILGLASYPDDYSSSSALKLCWSKDTSARADSNEYGLIPAGPIPQGGFRIVRNINYNQGFDIRKKYLMSSDPDPTGHFEFAIPFDHIFGFGNYKHAIWGVKHTLTFSRDNDDLAIYRAAGVDVGKVKLTQIIWKIPHLRIESTKKEELKSDMFNDKDDILMAFSARNGESFGVPVGVKEFSHTITRSSGLKKPRQIFVAFQTDKRADQTKNPAVFDNINLTKAILTLNGTRYPAFDHNIDYNKNQYATLYEWFDNFESDFNSLSPFVVGSQVNYTNFKKLYPIIHFDVTHQNDEIKSGVIVDIQLEFTTSEDTPANTRGFIVILYDKIVKLKPLSEKVCEVAV
jgi:hypothetical protein